MRNDNQRSNVFGFPERKEDQRATSPIMVPVGLKLDLSTVTVCGDILADHQLADGDRLIVNKSFDLAAIEPGDICIVKRGRENAPRRIWLNGDGSVTLFGPGVREDYKSIKDVKLLGVAIGFQRMFKGREW